MIYFIKKKNRRIINCKKEVRRGNAKRQLNKKKTTPFLTKFACNEENQKYKQAKYLTNKF